MKRLIAAALAVFSVFCVTTVVWGQDRIQVTQDRSPILASNLVTVVAYVDAGAELVFVRQQGEWIEVLLPGLNPRRSTGFVARVNLEPPVGAPVQGSAPDLPRAVQQRPAVPEALIPVSEREESESSTTQRRPATRSGLNSGLRGFGQIAVGSFFANQSFDAVLGSAPLPGHIRAPWWGGGAQFQFRGGGFFEGGVAFFRQTGQRVFVDGGTVFQLGIPDTVTVMPVMATIGYRFRGRSVAPFIGGGAGQYLYAEKTPFDQSAEFAWHHAASVHGLGGVEFRAAHNIAIAVQGQYTRVPGALAGGTASTFKESDLGGIQFGVKVLLGFPEHQRDPITNR